jgi:hypothetical protein
MSPRRPLGRFFHQETIDHLGNRSGNGRAIFHVEQLALGGG